MSRKTPSSVVPDIVLGNWIRTDVPNAKGWKCFVLNGAWYSAVVRLMAMSGFQRAESLEEADLVVFTGGSDISPKLYGEKPIKETGNPDADRDLFEEAIYHQCVKKNIPMFGICRGMQFLWAMNGGKLWQHVDNHAGKSHFIVDLEEDVRVKSSSYHHQAIMWDDEIGATMLAVCEDNIARVFKGDDLSISFDEETLKAYDGELEVEAAYIEKTKCFMVQGHPEVGSSEYASWTMTKLFECLLHWLSATDEKKKVS